MDYTEVFSYNPENIFLSLPDMGQSLIVAGVWFVFLFGAFYISLFFTGVWWLVNDAKEIKRRKRVLSDLILMKDIQTELEKEIEQATLKAAFQDGA